MGFKKVTKHTNNKHAVENDRYLVSNASLISTQKQTGVNVDTHCPMSQHDGSTEAFIMAAACGQDLASFTLKWFEKQRQGKYTKNEDERIRH